MTSEAMQGNTDHDPFHELCESLKGMGKKELIKARADAVKALVEAVQDHPSASEIPEKDIYSSSLPKVVTLPEAGVTIRADALDLSSYAFSPLYSVTLTSLETEDTTVQPKELKSQDDTLYGNNYSLRDMQTVVDDVIAMRTMQEQLSVGQAPQS